MCWMRLVAPLSPGTIKSSIVHLIECRLETWLVILMLSKMKTCKICLKKLICFYGKYIITWKIVLICLWKNTLLPGNSNDLYALSHQGGSLHASSKNSDVLQKSWIRNTTAGLIPTMNPSYWMQKSTGSNRECPQRKICTQILIPKN